MSDELNVEVRDQTGTLRMRRMRKSGQIPAILYGHGEKNIRLAVKAKDVGQLIRHGAHVVELRGAVNESALIKDVQWDQVGSDVLHLDLARVDASESIEVMVSVELRGDAPGTHQGGMLKHLAYELGIRCPAGKVPDRLELSVNQLELGGALLASDIELPAHAELVGSVDEVVVQCVVAIRAEDIEDEDEEAEGAPAEPEVIGRPNEDESEDQTS